MAEIGGNSDYQKGIEYLQKHNLPKEEIASDVDSSYKLQLSIFDADGNGKISIEEFNQVDSASYNAIAKNMLQGLKKDISANNGNKLSQKQIEELLKNTENVKYDYVREMVNRTKDKEGLNIFDNKTLTSYGLANSEVDAFLAQYDLNEDSSVNIPEYTSTRQNTKNPLNQSEIQQVFGDKTVLKDSDIFGKSFEQKQKNKF